MLLDPVTGICIVAKLHIKELLYLVFSNRITSYLLGTKEVKSWGSGSFLFWGFELKCYRIWIVGATRIDKPYITWTCFFLRLCYLYPRLAEKSTSWSCFSLCWIFLARSTSVLGIEKWLFFWCFLLNNLQLQISWDIWFFFLNLLLEELSKFWDQFHVLLGEKWKHLSHCHFHLWPHPSGSSFGSLGSSLVVFFRWIYVLIVNTIYVYIPT